MSAHLPSRPSLIQLKLQAKELQKGFRQGAEEAQKRVAVALAHAASGGDLTLADAQCVIAREYGFASWAKLKHHVEAVAEAARPLMATDLDPFERDARELIDHYQAGRIWAIRFLEKDLPGFVAGSGQVVTLEQARDLIARRRGFAGWAELEAAVRAVPEARKEAIRAAHEAVGSGDVSTLERLLIQDRDLGLTVDSSRTLLHHAATLSEGESAGGTGAPPAHRLDVMRTILRAGHNDPKERDHALLTVSSFDDAEVGQLLVDAGARVNGEHDDSVNLAFALRFRHRRAAEMLGRNGAKMDLRLAAGMGRLDLLPGFFDPSGRLREDAEVLHRPFVDDLPPNVPEDTLHQALVYACINNQPAAAAFLLDHGAEINVARPGFDVTMYPLHWAVSYRNRAVVDLLLDRGADIDVREERFLATPIDHANHGGGHGTAEDRARFIELRDYMIDRAGGLHDAVKYGRRERVDALLAADPGQVNAQREIDRASPLHQAVYGGHTDLAALLLDRGADPYRQTKEGKTALALAEELGREKIAVLLRHRSG